MQFGITGLSLPTKGHSYTLETSLDTPLSTRSLPRQNDNGLFSHWLPQSAATTPPSSVSLLFVALLHWHRQSTRFVHSETLYEILHCSNRIQCCPTGLCVLAVLLLCSVPFEYHNKFFAVLRLVSETNDVHMQQIYTKTHQITILYVTYFYR